MELKGGLELGYKFTIREFEENRVEKWIPLVRAMAPVCVCVCACACVCVCVCVRVISLGSSCFLS